MCVGESLFWSCNLALYSDFLTSSLQLASSLGPRFYANIFKCKQISETGAQQVGTVFLKVFFVSFKPNFVFIKK